MTTYTYLQACDRLSITSQELAQSLLRGELAYTVKDGRIFVSQESIDTYLKPKPVIEVKEATIEIEAEAELPEDEVLEDMVEEPIVEESATPIPPASSIPDSNIYAPTPTTHTSTSYKSRYADPTLIQQIEKLGYDFRVMEKIMMSIGRKRRGTSGALNITHLCKILNTELNCKNKKVRVALNKLLDVGFLSTKRNQAYSLTQRLSSITQPPLRQLLENYLTSD